MAAGACHGFIAVAVRNELSRRTHSTSICFAYCLSVENCPRLTERRETPDRATDIMKDDDEASEYLICVLDGWDSSINIMAGRNPAIPVHGKNFIVSDCDLWVSGTVFKSDGTCECMMM